MILTLSGASGTGKTTIAKMLMERMPQVKPIVSITTRAPRASDLPGDFEYISPDVFADMDAHGAFLWTATVGNTHKATRRKDLMAAFAKPDTLWIMMLVPERVPTLHAFAASVGHAADVRSFYILNPSEDVLRRRMHERGDAPDAIAERLQSCADFQTRAQALHTPLHFIEDRDDVEDKLRQIMHGLLEPV